MEVAPGHRVAAEPVEGGRELVLTARQDTTVHAGGGGAGDHVHLVAGLQHRRVGAVAHRRGDQAAGRPEPLDRLVDVEVGGAGVERDADGGTDLAQGCGHRRREPGRPAMGMDPGHRRRQRTDRVVVVDPRAVPGRAVGGELEPGSAPLAGADRVEADAGTRVERVGARLADALGAALEQVRVLAHEPVGAGGRVVLLVGGEGEHHVPGGQPGLAGQPPGDRQHHRRGALHVDRTASPDPAVGDLARERRHRPVGGLGRDDVEVRVHEQARPLAVGTRQTDDDVGPARGRLQEERFHPGVGELRGDVLGGRPLGAVAATPVGGVDADQVGGEAHDLAGGISHSSSRRRWRSAS